MTSTIRDNKFVSVSWGTTFTITKTLAEQFEDFTGYPPHGCKSTSISQALKRQIAETMQRRIDDLAMRVLTGGVGP